MSNLEIMNFLLPDEQSWRFKLFDQSFIRVFYEISIDNCSWLYFDWGNLSD